MSADWETVRAERAALADDLEQLSAEQWATPSLCANWTVHQVLGHMVATAKMTPPRFVAQFAAARFKFHDVNARGVRDEASGLPQQTLEHFRQVIDRRTAPPGPWDAMLGEVLVHSTDIRRPLGIAHELPLPAVTRATTFYAGSQPVVRGKSRVAGLTLRATDTEWSVGSGPLVEGPAASLMLATAGRTVALGDLTGPGVDVLRKRA